MFEEKDLGLKYVHIHHKNIIDSFVQNLKQKYITLVEE